MARQRNEALWGQWRQRVARYEQGAETAAVFCRREGVSLAGKRVGQRLLQKCVDRLGKGEAKQKADQERRRRIDDAVAQFDQMFEQRRFARLEFGFFFRRGHTLGLFGGLQRRAGRRVGGFGDLSGNGG